MTDTTPKYDNQKIIISGAREHNLKNITIELPVEQLIVFTGVSGSGKSSLVFDTIYAEGQRRYVESLSSYARQFLERINKPDVDYITGISPAVSIEQRTNIRNTRSTVGTTTEIYDYLRLLYARIGKTICYACGNEVKKASTSTVCDFLELQTEGDRYLLTFPLYQHEGKELSEELDILKKRGFFRIYHAGEIIDLNTEYKIPEEKENLYIVVNRFKIIHGEIREKLSDSIEITFKEGENRLAIINATTGQKTDFNKFYECHGVKYPEPEPRFFSFNNPFGACPVCQGFGKTYGIDIDLVIPDTERSILEGAIAPWRSQAYNHHHRDLVREAKRYNIPVNIPFRNLTEDQQTFVLAGNEKYIGVTRFFAELESQSYKLHVRVLVSRYRGYAKCSACKGSRLRREAMQIKVGGESIFGLVKLPIDKLLDFFNALTLSAYDLKIGERIFKELVKRLNYLFNVGLGYLTLDRLSSTLSGGESQRINLSTALGSALVGTLYILDEPSIGLHPRDNEKLIGILKNLRDIGNTVLVVEHDPDMMRTADMIVDVGPKAGAGGGEIVAYGTYDEIIANPASLTGKYLSGELSIPVPQKRRPFGSQSIQVLRARSNNLKNINVEFPLHSFVCITGVSGSGKSTLVHDIIYGGISSELGNTVSNIGFYDNILGAGFINQIEIVDQSPIGKSPRSNPVSYVKAYEYMREAFANTHQARTKNYPPGFFSFNVPGGRCDTCSGDGFIKVEMQFLADIYLECEDCKGTRFKKEIRDVTLNGKNMVEVLNMTVDESLLFFKDFPRIYSSLRPLADVGLGYIHLGQPSNTLSGGEAQRIKLASHLIFDRTNKHTLFIFDEPTTGLHYHDIAKLLECFNLLIEGGNSILIIEHNLEVIKCADYIIDLGPEAGEDGGEVIVCGTPEEIAKCERSWTGKYLKIMNQLNSTVKSSKTL